MMFAKRWLAGLMLCLALLIAAPAFGQAGLPANQPHAGVHYWNCFPDATLDDAIYWAHQPPAVRKLMSLNSEPERIALAIELAKQGYLIDVPIMVTGYDPLCTMGIRLGAGFRWVPSALLPPIAVAPGIDFPGIPKYDPDSPPQGAIKVSIDAKDYPPFDPPVAVSTVDVSKLPKLGNSMGGGIYGVGLGGRNVKDGDTVSEAGKTCLAHVSIGIMGPASPTIYFSCN